MKVVLLSRSGIVLDRSVYTEIARRMKDRGCDDECIGRFTASADEFQNEIEAYGASVA